MFDRGNKNPLPGWDSLEILQLVSGSRVALRDVLFGIFYFFSTCSAL